MISSPNTGSSGNLFKIGAVLLFLVCLVLVVAIIRLALLKTFPSESREKELSALSAPGARTGKTTPGGAVSGAAGKIASPTSSREASYVGGSGATVRQSASGKSEEPPLAAGRSSGLTKSSLRRGLGKSKAAASITAILNQDGVGHSNTPPDQDQVLNREPLPEPGQPDPFGAQKLMPNPNLSTVKGIAQILKGPHDPMALDNLKRTIKENDRASR